VPSAAFLPQGTQLAEPPRQLSPVRKRALLIGAVLLVLIVAGVGIILANSGGDTGGQNQASVGGGGHATTNQPAPSTGHTSTGTKPSNSSTAPSSPNSSSATTVASAGQIDWGAAGQKVLAFYSTSVLVSDPTQGWNMLSTGAQSVYGSEPAFAAYWQQYQQISSSGEHPVQQNPDGSVQVPADVVYGPHQGSQTTHLSLRVVQVGGQLLLDGDTHIPGTSIAPANSNNGGANSQ
jgi:hypothetical protein